MKHWWRDDKGNLKYWEKNLPLCPARHTLTGLEMNPGLLLQAGDQQP
jgi:hypothetical protein